MAPGRRCCIRGCLSSSHYGDGTRTNSGIRFFVIPSVKFTRGDDLREITRRRRLAWIAAIGRPDITFEKHLRGRFVCSKHFHKGLPAYEMMVNDPDWVPSLKLRQCVDCNRTDCGCETLLDLKQSGPEFEHCYATDNITSTPEAGTPSPLVLSFPPGRDRYNQRMNSLGCPGVLKDHKKDHMESCLDREIEIHPAPSACPDHYDGGRFTSSSTGGSKSRSHPNFSDSSQPQIVQRMFVETHNNTSWGKGYTTSLLSPSTNGPRRKRPSHRSRPVLGELAETNTRVESALNFRDYPRQDKAKKDVFKADSKGEPFVVVRRGQASLNRGSSGPGKFSSMDKKLNGRSFRIISSDSDRTTTFGRNPAREKDRDLIDTGHRKLRADALKAPVAPGPGNLGMRTEHGGLTDEVKQFQLRLQDENLDVGIVMKERPCEASLKAFLASIIGRGDVDNVSAFGDSSQDVWEGASPDVSSRPGSVPSVHSGVDGLSQPVLPSCPGFNQVLRDSGRSWQPSQPQTLERQVEQGTHRLLNQELSKPDTQLKKVLFKQGETTYEVYMSKRPTPSGYQSVWRCI